MNQHPIRLTNADDCVRSRLTVFFRYLLVIPHLLWLQAWAVAIVFVWIVSWFATLFTGRTPDGLHRFTAAFVRYTVHVTAFLLLVANPFPGFAGAEGTYPVDLQIAPPERQNRWKTFFRLVLALPAAVLAGLLQYALYGVAIFGWFAAMATGRMPTGFQRLGVYALRYHAQLNSYALLLSDAYPYSGPDSEWADRTTGSPGPGLSPPTAPAPPVPGAAPSPLAPGASEPLAGPTFRDPAPPSQTGE